MDKNVVKLTFQVVDFRWRMDCAIYLNSAIILDILKMGNALVEVNFWRKKSLKN